MPALEPRKKKPPTSPSSAATRAQVFIIESMRLDEEDHREGEVISRTLKMSVKEPRYEYIRTRQELDHFLDEFEDSGYRYLHLSCHGDENGIALTFDYIPIEELADMLRPVLIDRRLFLSACKVTTKKFASLILEEDGCFSVAGPVGKPNTDDSAVFWSAFYHIMFKNDPKRMKRKDVQETLSKMGTLVDVQMRYFALDDGEVIQTTLPKPSKPASRSKGK